MIPDHIIEKAAMSAYDDHYWRDELYLLWGELGDRIQDEYRALARAALEAVAADIWDEGWEQGMAYVVGMERGIDDDLDHATTNPYRASEGK